MIVWDSYKATPNLNGDIFPPSALWGNSGGGTVVWDDPILVAERDPDEVKAHFINQVFTKDQRIRLRSKIRVNRSYTGRNPWKI